MMNLLELTSALIRSPSLTPDDAGCQALIQSFLAPLGFEITHLDSHGVKNLWAISGKTGPLLTFIGHTDVVPPGPLDQWHTHPFEPHLIDDRLYGRGAADMKGSLAAMLIACREFLRKHPRLRGRLAFAITSDEEGPGQYGSRLIAEYLQKQNIHSHYYLVGEPSSEERLGDTIKIGRRGSLHGHLTLRGRQGHIAYPQLANNPIQKLPPLLTQLYDTVWDEGLPPFPPTHFQISQLQAGTGAKNVIPGRLDMDFNLRFSPASSPEALRKKVENILNQTQVDYELAWELGASPFLSPSGKLYESTLEAIQSVCHLTPQASTAGGTSDGRFFAGLGGEILELGPINASIHQPNEWVSLHDLEQLTTIYQRILSRLLL